MNCYLAKSNPPQTIQEHTDKLLENLTLLRKIYPKLEVNWQLLEDAVIYHDLGKMNLKFQDRIASAIRYDGEIAHNLLSLAFLNVKELLNKYREEDIVILAQAIAYHHERGDYDDPNYNNEVELLKKEADNFTYNKVKIDEIKKISKKYFSNNRIYEDNPAFFDYIKLKGFLNKLDYSASADIDVEIKNTFLLEGLHNLGYKWNNLQEFMLSNQDNNIVVVAQTGMGKTEAGLLWIGDNKGFYTLPIKTAINEIYKRIINNIVDIDHKQSIGLLHSDTLSKYLEYKIESEEDVFNYYIKTKQLSLPVTICTLDQLFNFVFRFRGFESILSTLNYSKVVIDEIQMYSSDLLAYLIIGLYYIIKIGGKFAILTATLPGIIIDLLKQENIPFVKSEKCFIDNNFIRHSLKVENCSISSKEIIKHYCENKILVICNTIKKAQELYEEICRDKKLRQKCKHIKLFHSRFIKKHRKEKEKDIFSFGQLGNKEKGIWITTQVVEASLDIDFDLLITELSDVNSLFQRMGRCYRKREFKGKGYNCFVFNGGDKQCSGVGNVIDRKIFELSKEAIKNIDGIITEQEKLDLIEKIYTTDKLKNTDYYKDIINNINYLKSINEYELSKDEVNKRFRNIDTIPIIPKCVYFDNKERINELITELSISEDKETKIKLRDELFQFTVDINYYMIEKKQPQRIAISRYEELLIYDGFTYNGNIGLQVEKNQDNQSKDNYYNNFID